MAKGIFVTGSGTGIGKTYVSVLLLKGFSALGLVTTYMKPVETGCGEPPAGGGMPDGPDTLYALGFASYKTGIDLHSPYRFPPACSPHLAAREAGCEISVDKIVSTYENLVKNSAADIIVVEGAGGVLAPIDDNDKYMADVMKALSIPAVLVSEPDLGTLNHTFLSMKELVRQEIPTVGVVINNVHSIGRGFVYEDNVRMIRKHAGPIPCVDVDYGEDIEITEFCREIISSI
jgi:dethiobiotin synthetase